MPLTADYELSEINTYKKQFGGGISGGMDINYQLSNKFAIQLRQNASYFLTSITQNNNPVNSYLYRFGLSAGIKYQLQ